MEELTLLQFWLRDMRDSTIFQCPPVTCKDGLSMSIQASVHHYCTPRNNIGPWTHVEVGFPTKHVKEFEKYGDDAYSSVYCFVPIELVAKVIKKHGGWSDEQQLA
jgi:hypothetical protein